MRYPRIYRSDGVSILKDAYGVGECVNGSDAKSFYLRYQNALHLVQNLEPLQMTRSRSLNISQAVQSRLNKPPVSVHVQST